MLTALLNLPITIIQRGRDTTPVTDEFGNEKPSEQLLTTVGELQQQRRTEPADEGELSDSTWLLILPAGTDIRGGDATVAGGHVYELIGAPWNARNPRTHLLSHIECTLRRTAAADDEDGS